MLTRFFRCVGNRAIENDAHTHLHTYTGRATNVLKVLMSSATVLTMECGMQNDYLCQMPNFNLITLSACVCVCIFFSWTSKVQCTLNTRVTWIFFRWISKYSSDFFAICNWLKEKIHGHMCCARFWKSCRLEICWFCHSCVTCGVFFFRFVLSTFWNLLWKR